MKAAEVLAAVLALCLVLSVGAFASSDMPDTSQGGSATSRPPDNSTKAVDILGTRAALGVETYIGDDGSVNISLGGLLDAIGAEMSFDEVTGTLTVKGIGGAIGGLLGAVG